MLNEAKLLVEQPSLDYSQYQAHDHRYADPVGRPLYGTRHGANLFRNIFALIPRNFNQRRLDAEAGAVGNFTQRER